MSRAGNSYDNAAMESFFHTLKTEFVQNRDKITLQTTHRVILRRRLSLPAAATERSFAALKDDNRQYVVKMTRYRSPPRVDIASAHRVRILILRIPSHAECYES